MYVENLLGETIKLYFQNWRSAYPDAFNTLCMNSDETHNITSQIRQIIFGHDEYRGQTVAQNQALLQLERLSINNMKDYLHFARQYLHLASQTGAAFLSTELSDKFFRKLPEPFNSKMHAMFLEKYPSLDRGIAPRIKYTYEVIQELCRQNEIARQAKDFSFCKEVEVPGVYRTERPKKNLRRSTTYKGKNPHSNNVRKFKTRKPAGVKCKCFICGEEGHYANNCNSRSVNKERLAIYTDLALNKETDIVSMDEGEDLDDSDIC